MTASLYDSAIYRDLMTDRDIAALFTDTAEVRAMMIVEGALAMAQARAGVIPDDSARAIHRAALEIQIDPGALAAETGMNAVVVPALVTQFRAEMKAPEHAQWLHYGATSQDIMDTGLALRLRQVLTLCEARLRAVLAALGDLAQAHATTPMAGRTYGQIATPTSFGAVVAGWGQPLLSLLAQVPQVRACVQRVSLSGAAGTLSAMGDAGPAVRAGLAQDLGLSDPGHSWHSDRSGIAGLAAWITQVCATLAKMGEDIGLMTQTGIAEVRLPAAGGSSTMPQKQNPVMPSVLVAIARHGVALNSVIQGAAIHRQQRDGAAWISEWMTLPQMCLGLGRALTIGTDLARGVVPDPAAMARHIDDGTALIYAEALSFHMTRSLPRPEAQAAVKTLCKAVMAQGGTLRDAAAALWPDADLAGVFDPVAHLGLAPADARAFAVAAKAIAK